MNELLRRLVEEECRHSFREWSMRDLRRLGKDEAEDLVVARLLVPSAATRGKYVVDDDAVARTLRSYGSSRPLQGGLPECVHWGFVYLGYFVERARVVACVWALRPIDAYSDPHPGALQEFWNSVPDGPDEILFVWPEWESWEEFAASFPDLKTMPEVRHEPLGEWLGRIRVSPDAPRVTRLEPDDPDDVVFGINDGQYEVRHNGQILALAEGQAALLLHLAYHDGYVRRERLRELVGSRSPGALATLVHNVNRVLGAGLMEFEILAGGREGHRLVRSTDTAAPLSFRAEAALESRPDRVATAAREINRRYRAGAPRR